jgi:hypothetical protein
MKECFSCDVAQRLWITARMAYCELEGLEMPSVEELEEQAPDAAEWLESKGYDRLTPELLRGMDKQQVLPARGRDDLLIASDLVDREALVI